MDWTYIFLGISTMFCLVLGAMCEDGLKGVRIHQFANTLFLFIIFRLCLDILTRFE